MDTSNSYKALKCVKGKKLQLQGFCITVDTLYTEMQRPCDGVPDNHPKVQGSVRHHITCIWNFRATYPI